MTHKPFLFVVSSSIIFVEFIFYLIVSADAFWDSDLDTVIDFSHSIYTWKKYL